MNGRQAARAAAQRIKEMEYIVAMQSKDIKGLYATVLDMIAGKSPCERCEENRLDECEHASLGSAGCSGWWLRTVEPEGGEQPDEEGERKTEGVTDSIFGVEEQ